MDSMDSIRAACEGSGYAIPGEFVMTSGRKL